MRQLESIKETLFSTLKINTKVIKGLVLKSLIYRSDKQKWLYNNDNNIDVVLKSKLVW